MKYRLYGWVAVVAGILVAASGSRADDGKAVVTEAERAKIEAQLAGTYNPLSFYNGKLVLDVQERLRGEYRANNVRFNDAVADDTDEWLLQRARLGLAIAPFSMLKFYGQLQDSREFDSTRVSTLGNVNLDEADVDLRQAYVEVADYKVNPFGLKVGRQELSYGDERLIGAFDWNNIGRVFDAIKARYQTKKESVDLFAANVVLNNINSGREDDFDDKPDSADDFYGIYGQCSEARSQIFEAYTLYRDKQDATYDGPAREIWAYGLRVKSKPITAPFDYSAEAVIETGEIDSPGSSSNRRFGENTTNDTVDHFAYAFVAGGGYTLVDTPWQPRFGAEYDYASGDEDPTDGENNTLDNFYPTNHKFFGFMDEFAWKNLSNPGISLGLQPTPTLKTLLYYRMYWLAEDKDFWYRASGAPSASGRRDASGNSDSYLGSEVDLAFWWTVTKKVAVHCGYSHFFAGGFVEDTAGTPDASNGDDDGDLAYLQTSLTF